MLEDNEEDNVQAFDVLVVGSGIAGICAAIEAGRAGATVALASMGKTMSGSSFFPGTWGLGLIGPESEDDIEDLVATILEVGGGVADEQLVRTFVNGIPEAITWLEDDLGVELKRPTSAQSAQEKTFIPCFDHKQRMWRGITRESLERAALAELERLGVTCLPGLELVDLLEANGGERIAGGVFFDRGNTSIEAISATATVIATGGSGGLFERSLTSTDVLSSTQGIAAAHGADLINIEFMQMMPGFVAPKRNLVFNEKTWRYVRFDAPVDIDTAKLPELLEMRSGYGPFTSRLPSSAIDLAIDQAGPEGLPIHYEFPTQNVPEFVQTFATWLKEEHGISPTDEMRIAMYAHAANGGIKIDTRAQTARKGLFACGEATGGMHGADRIGGISSANGVVFGRIAGKNAAAFAEEHTSTKPTEMAMGRFGIDLHTAQNITTELKKTMTTFCMIKRTAAGLAEAEKRLENLSTRLNNMSTITDKPQHIAAATRLRSQLFYAQKIIKAAQARTESLGSHNRADQ